MGVALPVFVWIVYKVVLANLVECVRNTSKVD